MALYDYTYTTPGQDGQDGDDDTEPPTDQTIWILTRSPGMVTGHSTKNGSVVSSMWVADIAKMATGAWLSSVLTVTRQSKKSKEDILLMGAIDANQEPSLLVVGAGGASTNQKPRLLWVTKIAEKKNANVTFTIEGQIVNYVDGVMGSKVGDDGDIGLYAMVVEHDEGNGDTVYVKGIFKT